MDANSTGRRRQQQQQSGALHVHTAHTGVSTASASSNAANAQPWRATSPARSVGVRRRREESIEIEELDSETMRQSSYNYFQRYTRRPSSPAYNSSGYAGSANAAFAYNGAAGSHTSSSSPLRHGSSRKRQRTLADQLDELCIGGVGYFGRRSGSRGPGGVGGVDVAMDGDSGGEGRDEEEDEDDRAETRSELMVYGGVPSMKGFFFGSSRRRPMDRVFRHYAAVANQAAASAETSGNELVLFRRAPPPTLPSPYLASLPYLSFSPQELEALTRQEKSKRASVVVLSSSSENESDQERRRATVSSGIKGAYRSRSASASSTSSPPFRALGVPRTDSFDGDLEDVDMDGAGVLNDPKLPHLSGDVSHSEWFLDDDEL